MPSIYKLSNLEELKGLIVPDAPLFVDTETMKLGSDIRLVQVFQEQWEQALLFDTLEVDVNRLWITLREHHLIGHNFLYDLGVFKEDMYDGLYEGPRKWDDTFYLSRLTFPEWNTAGGYSLDNALTKVLGYDPYKKQGLVKKDMQLSYEKTGTAPLSKSQLLYGAIDVYELPHLWHKVKHMTEHMVYKLDIQVCGTIMRDSLGMPVDVEELEKLRLHHENNIAELSMPFNVNSYQQVRKQLGTVLSSDEIALRIIENRPGGLTGLWIRAKMSNGRWAKALREGIDSHTISVVKKNFGKAEKIVHSSQLPSSNKILVYYKETSYVHSEEKAKLATRINSARKSIKRLNFVKRAYEAMDDKHRIRAHFSPHAINGRIQQDNENLTQYPRDFKAMWGHPKGSGRKLIYCDFAQIELRTICAILPEMNMYEALKEGKDLHSYVAEQFNFSQEEIDMLPAGQNPRQVAKQANFLLLYGGGATNFQRVVCRNSGVWFEDSMSKAIVTKWKDVFSDIKAWHEVNSRSATKMDKTVLGRPYKASIVTDLNNIKVSGTGAEVFKQWLIKIDALILDDDTFIVNRVHDSVTIDVVDDPKVYIPKAQLLAKLAQKAWFDTIAHAPLTDVPMPVDVGVGSNMAGIEYGTDVDYTFTLEPYAMMNKEIRDEL